MGGICLDIFKYENIDGIQVKKDAIEIRFIREGYYKRKYYVYELRSNGDAIFIKPK